MKQSEKIFIAYCLGKLFPKIFFSINEQNFQNQFTESGRQRGLLAHNIISILFKNNAMKKLKICSIKTFEQPLLYSPKADQKQSGSKYFTQITGFRVCKNMQFANLKQKNWSHVHGNLLKSYGFYRFFFILYHFILYHLSLHCFLQIILSHPLCYLRHALFKARKIQIFKIFSLRPTLLIQRH